MYLPQKFGHVARRLCGLAACIVALAAHAQTASSWPTRPLRIVVGFAAGSSPDLVARTLSEPLSKALGTPVIVENHPGASGNIAADIVAKSTDQHTVGMLINGNLTIAKVLNPATPYDPQKDLAPLSLICTAPLVLAVPAGNGKGDAAEFLTAARAAGDRWSYGTPGIGTLGHLGMELLKSQTGIKAVHVPYQGNPQVIGGLVGGQIQLALLPPGLADAQIRAGRLRPIGVTSSTRSALVPGFPTLEEGGVHGFDLDIWTAAASPSTMPPEIRARLSALIAEVTNTPEVRQKLFQQGYQAVGSSADVLAERLRKDTAALSRIIRDQGVRIE